MRMTGSFLMDSISFVVVHAGQKRRGVIFSHQNSRRPRPESGLYFVVRGDEVERERSRAGCPIHFPTIFTNWLNSFFFLVSQEEEIISLRLSFANEFFVPLIVMRMGPLGHDGWDEKRAISFLKADHDFCSWTDQITSSSLYTQRERKKKKSWILCVCTALLVVVTGAVFIVACGTRSFTRSVMIAIVVLLLVPHFGPDPKKKKLSLREQIEHDELSRESSGSVCSSLGWFEMSTRMRKFMQSGFSFVCGRTRRGFGPYDLVDWMCLFLL